MTSDWGLDTIETESQISVLEDTFRDALPAGNVVGSESGTGAIRKGSDLEDVISIDGNGLRIGYMRQPGWGRHGLVYGPFERENGLALSVFMLNGHNTSEADSHQEGGLKRIIRPWIRKLLLRLGTDWLPIPTPRPPVPFHVPPLEANLAVGWFDQESPTDPAASSHVILMHPTGPENGELRAAFGTTPMHCIRGVQNLPLYFIVILRKQGAAYYVASVPGMPGLSAYPEMRLVAVDPSSKSKELYAGLYQSVLGERGFQVDTRVYGIRIARLNQYDRWYGTAQLADSGRGQDVLNGSEAEQGGFWHVLAGTFKRTEDGIVPEANQNLAVLTSDEPVGLVHVMLTKPDDPYSAGVVWRAEGAESYWEVRLQAKKARLYCIENGILNLVQTEEAPPYIENPLQALQVLDDGSAFRIFLNGHLLFGGSIHDTRLNEGPGAGITAEGPKGACFSNFECHPRRIAIPESLDLGPPWLPPQTDPVFEDTFDGEAGPLDGRSIGDRVWKRWIGSDKIELTGVGSARVVADVAHPCKGRTAYLVDWNRKTADLEVDMIAPGTARGQGHTGRGSLFFYQDADNYMVVNCYFSDRYDGRAVSSFFRINGREDIYNAVWSNIGRRIHWGVPFTFRVAFDGNHYMAFVNDEPVLYRALSDVYPDFKGLSVQKVGLGVNWEYGSDTGTLFKRISARG